MDFNLKNKYALITGGSHGIGKAIALALAEEGCNVAICARNKARLQKTEQEIKSKGVHTLAISANVMVINEVGRVMDILERAWPKLNILINNVGGGGRWGNEVVEDTLEDTWWEVYNKNAMAAVRFTMWAIPILKEQGWGRVVTVASILGKEGGGRPWFNMAKAAEISLMKTLAMNPDLARHNITFNSVAPGAIMIPNTGWDKLRKESPEEFELLEESLPLGRLGTPEEVANMVTFLCSEQASLINGACIAIDGGESHSF